MASRIRFHTPPLLCSFTPHSHGYFSKKTCPLSDLSPSCCSAIPPRSSFLEASVSGQPRKDPASLPRQPLTEKPKKPSWHRSQVWPSTPGRQGHCPVLGWHWSSWEPHGWHLQLQLGKGRNPGLGRVLGRSRPRLCHLRLAWGLGTMPSVDKVPSLCRNVSNSLLQAVAQEAHLTKFSPSTSRKGYGDIVIYTSWTIPFSWKITRQLAY